MSTEIITRITEEQKRQWATDGYIVIKSALLPEDITELSDEIDRLHSEHLLKNPESDSRREFSRRPVVEEGSIFIKMMDYKPTFGLVLDLLGPCIQLSMSQALIRPANTEYHGFVHTDGGQAMQRIRVREAEGVDYPEAGLGAMVTNQRPRSGSRLSRCSRAVIASLESLTPLR